MKQRSRFLPLQAFGALAAIMVLVSGVTFAALRSQNDALNGNRMSSASANLQMAHQNDGNWYDTMNGYDFFNLMPGGEAGPKTGNDLYLRNAGTTDLSLQASLNPARLSNPNQVDSGKVKLVIVDQNQAVVASPSLGALWDAYAKNSTVPLNITIPASSVQHYQLRMQLLDGALTSSSSQATMENIDLILSGTAAGV